MLVSRVEPQSISNHRAAQAIREIAIRGALIAAVKLPDIVVCALHRLAGECPSLPVVGRVILKAVTAGLADHVHDGALDVAVLD